MRKFLLTGASLLLLPNSGTQVRHTVSCAMLCIVFGMHATSNVSKDSILLQSRLLQLLQFFLLRLGCYLLNLSVVVWCLGSCDAPMSLVACDAVVTRCWQVVFAMLISMVTAIAVLKLRPMAVQSDNLVVMFASWALWFQLFAGLLIRTSVTVKDGYDNTVMGVIIAIMIAMVPLSAIVAVLVEVYTDLWDVRPPLSRACRALACTIKWLLLPAAETSTDSCLLVVTNGLGGCGIGLMQVYTFKMDEDDKWVLDLLPLRVHILLLLRYVCAAVGVRRGSVQCRETCSETVLSTSSV